MEHPAGSLPGSKHLQATVLPNTPVVNDGNSPPDTLRLLCSDSSPEKPDTYLNVESGDLPTDTETTGLVTNVDKFRLLGGLEPSPELIAISMGTVSPSCIIMHFSITHARAVTLL